MQCTAEIPVSFTSILSFHIFPSSTLCASSLNFECMGEAMDTSQTEGKDVMAAHVIQLMLPGVERKDRKVMHRSQRRRAKMRHRAVKTGKKCQRNYNTDSFTLASAFASSEHLIAFLWRRFYFWAVSNATVSLKSLKRGKVDLSQRKYRHCPCPSAKPIPLWQ